MSDLPALSQGVLRHATPSRNRCATVPGTTVRLLTQTSKMPGPSWSLPAHKACPRANGTICDGCYASKGCYQYSTTRNAQDTRFRWTVESIRTAEGIQAWVETMVAAIAEAGCEYFRVHDSGDMFSSRYAEAWLEVCIRLPHVKFWIPTRAWQQPSGPLPVFDPLLNTLRKLAQLPNVAVRPSALNFGDYAPVVSALHAGSTAAMPDVFRARQCPAYAQGGQCGDCRACWDEKDMPVSYCRH
jgi:hypothetical protein